MVVRKRRISPIFHQKIIFYNVYLVQKLENFGKNLIFFCRKWPISDHFLLKNIFRGVSSGNSLTITRIENRAGRNDLDVVNFYNQ